ncbi:MAG: hypothetical protein ABSD82_11030 [Solirubrobacteraceae bacterium]
MAVASARGRSYFPETNGVTTGLDGDGTTKDEVAAGSAAPLQGAHHAGSVPTAAPLSTSNAVIKIVGWHSRLHTR